MGKGLLAVLCLTLVEVQPVRGQQDSGSASDSGFLELQRRGQAVMGVDQYSSAHQFEDLPDGGRIELQRDTLDSADVRTIREHLAGIARAFARGDFTAPGLVHARNVPGTGIMRTRRAAILYRFTPLPRGGEVRITTRDPVALRAIHEFLAFQRGEHHAAGHGER